MPRVVEHLNQAMHQLFSEDDSVYLVGEDLLDPYGGAFKVSEGLSTKFPDRVLTTPISEQSIVGVASGLSLRAKRPIAEIMFGDFMGLSFDMIYNFISKSVTMYGKKLDLNLMIRCPYGGHRGYGATHSQTPQKHFIGIPNLELFEISPFHDLKEKLPMLVNLNHPCILFENKVLYTKDFFADSNIDELFSFDFIDTDKNIARIFLNESREPEVTFIAPGGMVYPCLAAARRLFLEQEIECQILVPFKLYPFELKSMEKIIVASKKIFVMEESVAGGTWGSEVAHTIYDQLFEQIRKKVSLVHSKDSIIPSSVRLEKSVLITEDDIISSVRKNFNNA